MTIEAEQFQAHRAGAVELDVSTTAADIDVVCSDRAQRAEVRAVGGLASFTEVGSRLTVRIPDEETSIGGGVTVVGGSVSFGRGGLVSGNGVTFVNGRRYDTGGGSVSVRDGRVFVNGVEVDPAGGAAADSGPRGARQLQILLPQGSRVSLATTSGDVTVAQGGDVRVNSVSGDVEVVNLPAGGQAVVTTVSGDVLIGTKGLARAQVETVSGNIVTVGPVQLQERTVSGRVRQR